MIPVTIVIIALHIVLALRLVFFNRYPQEVKNTATEPTLLEMALFGSGIVSLSINYTYGAGGAFIFWMILRFLKRKKISNSE